MPTVAVVGRPNVGKSTLFNRIVGEQAAIVEDRPGVTRDRKVLDAEWLGVPFRVVDTGGWMPGGSDLDAKVSRQVEAAVAGSPTWCCSWSMPPSVSPTTTKRSPAGSRRGGHDVIVVANKSDNDRREAERWEFMALGLGEPYPVSALHGRRAGDLLDEVVARFPIRTNVDARTTTSRTTRRRRCPMRRAWRSSGDRTSASRRCSTASSARTEPVVHDLAGTTRDAIDTLVETDDGPIVFVDTAGMRRRSRIDDSAEYYSLVRALRAIDDADIALLVIDATEGVTGQDQRLAERVDAAGCPIVVLLNKWELVDDAEDPRRHARRADAAAGLHRRRAGAEDLGADRQGRAQAAPGAAGRDRAVPPPGADEGRQPRARRRAAAPARPAAARRCCSRCRARAIRRRSRCSSTATSRQPYVRYLERSLREAFDFGSTPLKLRVRKKNG